MSAQEDKLQPPLTIEDGVAESENRENPQRVQWCARPDGIAGIPGIPGNVVSVTYRI